jgi:6-phosphogluconolactonase
MDIKVFDSSEAVLRSLAEDLLLYSQQSESVHISLSGGSTPKSLFNYIVASHYAKKIQWQNLHFWWGDERCVSPTDEQSNFGVAKDLLFQHITIPMSNLHRIRGENDPVESCQGFVNEMRSSIRILNGRPQFDWVLLGVGDDGHTASLFPGQTDYTSPYDAIVAKQAHTGQLRISMTAPVIQCAKRVTFLVLGASKASIVREVVAKEGHWQDYPAANIQTEQGVTQWYIDRLAASKLS